MFPRCFLIGGLFTSLIFISLSDTGTAGEWDAEQKWEIKTAGIKIPVGWEPFAYDSNDEFDPFLIRRCTTDAAAAKQKWEIKTAGIKIPVGWEPFAYDSNDEFDPFLIRRRIK